MRKKFLKILALSSLMLTAGGVMAISQLNNRNDIHIAEASIYKYTFDDATEQSKWTWNGNGTQVYSSGNNNYSDLKEPGETSFFFYKNSSTSATGTLTLNESIDHIYGLKFKLATSDKAKSYITIKIGDEVILDKGTVSSMYADQYRKSNRNNTWAEVDLSSLLKEGKSGQLSFTFSSKSSTRCFALDDIVIDNTMKHSVSFIDGTTTLSTQTIKESEFATAPELTDSLGKVFVGWDDGTSILSKTTIDAKPVTSPVTYTAKWDTVDVWTVTFDSNGGSTVESQKINNGNLATEPEIPVHQSGKTFGEWQLDGVKYDFATPVTGNITLVAKWDAPIYSESIAIEQEGFTWTNPTEVKKLSATIDDKNGTVNTHPEVTWTSNNTNVVTVDKDGNLTAVNKGEATITATIYAGDVEHEKSSSIKIIVPLANLSTAVNEDLFADFYTLAASRFEEAEKDSKKPDQETVSLNLDGENFGGFTLISLNNGNDTKWNSAKAGNNRGQSLMTNAGFTFTAKKKGTLTVEWTTTSTSARYITINGVDYKITSANSYVTTTIELNAGKYTIKAAGTGSDSDHKIWYKTMRFSEKVETNWVDTTVHLTVQKGVMNGLDAIRFFGYVDAEALDYIKNMWFTVKINGDLINTQHTTTLYKQIYYYDETGTKQQIVADTDLGKYYYFSITIVNIPSDFTGKIEVSSNISDAEDIQYQSIKSVEVNYENGVGTIKTKEGN